MKKVEKPEISDKSSQITVRLAPEILEKLYSVSSRVGVKPAQIASLAIGDYVTKMDASYGGVTTIQTLMAKEMGAALAFQLSTLFEGKSFEEVKEAFKDD